MLLFGGGSFAVNRRENDSKSGNQFSSQSFKRFQVKLEPNEFFMQVNISVPWDGPWALHSQANYVFLPRNQIVLKSFRFLFSVLKRCQLYD